MTFMLNFDDYTIAWLAVLPIEAEAALGMLDKQHEGSFETQKNDDYIYIGGEINHHNVVVATWPSGQNYGPDSAAALANQVKARFRNIWFALLVGVAAGLPNLNPKPPVKARDIRLGDVLVCVPDKTSPGIVHYDLGKFTEDEFALISRQAEPPAIVRSAITNIQLTKKNPFKEGNFLAEYLLAFQRKVDDEKFLVPHQSEDKLFLNMQDTNSTPVLASRARRDELERTLVWYGRIGSGSSMMRNSRRRDELRDRYNLIGLEMEAAGIMNTLPTGVIRGVCDYGDNQKTKDWQPYAAAVAAAYGKGILSSIYPEFVEQKRDDKRPGNQGSNSHWPRPANKTYPRSSDYQRQFNLRVRERFKGTCEWFFDHDDFLWWYSTSSFSLLWLSGTSGIGKSTLLAHVVSKLQGSTTDTLLKGVHKAAETIFSFCHTQIVNSAEEVISNLIYDLLDKFPELNKDAARILPRFELGRQRSFPHLNSQLSAPRLWHLLKELVSCVQPYRIFIILDALDECDEESQAEMIHLFGDSEKVQNLNILFSSRNNENVRIEYSKLKLHLASLTRHLEMDIEKACVSGINGDIDCFLKAEIARIVDLRGFMPEERIMIEDYMRENHSSLFLFIKLAVKKLERAPVSELNRTLRGSVAGELTEMYDNLLSEMPDSMRNKPSILLMLLMYACKPLSVRELAIFTSLIKQSWAGQENFSNSESHQAFRNDLRLYGSLLRVRQDDSVVELIHPSAKEYLITSSAIPKHAMFLVRPNVAHESLAMMCLMKLISSRDVEYPATWMNGYETKIELLLTENPALAYSLRFWYQHLQKIPELKNADSQIHQPLQQFMEQLVQLWETPKYHDFRQMTMMHTGLAMPEFKNHLSAFEYFSWLGLCAFISPLLSSNSYALVQETNQKAESAVHLAILAGHKDASILIMRHFHITSLQGRQFANIIKDAVKSGDVELAELVSKMHIQSSDDLASAVPEAFKQGKVEMLHTFSTNQTGLSVTDGFGMTALHRLYNRQGGILDEKDDAVIVATSQFFVKHGVGVNAVDNMGNTALHYACWTSTTRNDEQYLIALLELGADPRIRNNYGWTAFDLAVRYVSNSRILQILLRSGGTALASSRSNGGRTTLHWVAQRHDIHNDGGHEVIRCLLLNGVDPNIPFKGITGVDLMSKRRAIRDAFESVFGLIGIGESVQGLPRPETVIDNLNPNATAIWALAQAQQARSDIQFVPSSPFSEMEDNLSDDGSFYTANED